VGRIDCFEVEEGSEAYELLDLKGRGLGRSGVGGVEDQEAVLEGGYCLIRSERPGGVV